MKLHMELWNLFMLLKLKDFRRLSVFKTVSLLVRGMFEADLVEVCHPKNCNVGLLCYSPLAGGVLSGKYLDSESEAAKKGRLQLFPGFMVDTTNPLSRKQLHNTLRWQRNMDRVRSSWHLDL